jgi:hypothetical protein
VRLLHKDDIKRDTCFVRVCCISVKLHQSLPVNLRVYLRISVLFDGTRFTKCNNSCPSPYEINFNSTFPGTQKFSKLFSPFRFIAYNIVLSLPFTYIQTISWLINHIAIQHFIYRKTGIFFKEPSNKETSFRKNFPLSTLKMKKVSSKSGYHKLP